MQLITAKDTFILSVIGRKYSPFFHILLHFCNNFNTSVYNFQVVFIPLYEDKLRRMSVILMDMYFSHSLANVILEIIHRLMSLRQKNPSIVISLQRFRY